jgi:hypothetical protein
MGHEKVDTTLNVYTQAADESVRGITALVGRQLFPIVRNCSQPAAEEGLKSLN